MPRKLCQSIHYYVNYHQFERLENPVAGGYKYLRETQGTALPNFSLCWFVWRQENKRDEKSACTQERQCKLNCFYVNINIFSNVNIGENISTSQRCNSNINNRNR